VGGKQMKSKIFEALNDILSEGDWAEASEETNNFIRDMREKNIHAADEALNDNLEEDEDKSTGDEKEEESDSDIENEDEEKKDLQSLIKLEDAGDFEKLLDILNRFRASKSLSDKDVNSELSEFFNRLTSNEKSVLYVLIKGLVQITQQEVSGKAANTPSDMMFDTNKKGSVSSEKAKSILKKQNSKKEAEASSLTPIKIESLQEKREILDIIKSNV
jgi:hypothetical protein